MTLAKLIEELRAIEKRVAALATEAERIKRQSVETMIGPVEWNGKAVNDDIKPDGSDADRPRGCTGERDRAGTCPVHCKPPEPPRGITESRSCRT
jgi:hypothetical protein